MRANNWIGDVVMISPAIRALREHFIEAEIAILARPWICEALAPNPSFDRLIPYEVPGRHDGPLGRLRLAAELRKQSFDLAVLFQKAFDAAFLAAAARIPLRVGYDTERRGFLLTHPIPMTRDSEWRHHLDFFLEVAIACGCHPSSREPAFVLAEEDRAWAASFLGEPAPPGTEPPAVEDAAAGSRPLQRAHREHRAYAALHAGGSKAPRAWHASRFALLARWLYQDLGLLPIVVGDASDAASAEEITRAAPGTIVAVGRTSVRQMAALIERCAIFVGNDSGPMHIAGALGIPTVGIFGPGIPEKTAPRRGLGRHSVDADSPKAEPASGATLETVTLRFPCAPCRQDFFRECDPAPSGKPHCLEGITVESVAAACRRVLASAGHEPRR